MSMCVFMGIDAGFCVSMGVFGCLCVSMGVYGNLDKYEYSRIYGCLWEFLYVYGVYGPMGRIWGFITDKY